MTRAKKQAASAPPSNAELHRQVLAKLEAMTLEERIQTLVDAGILTKTRRVKKVYREEPLLSHRGPLAAAE